MDRIPIHDAAARRMPPGSMPPPPPQPQPQPQQHPPPQNAAGDGPPLVPQGPPQLPPQMFTTAAQLLDLTDSEW